MVDLDKILDTIEDWSVVYRERPFNIASVRPVEYSEKMPAELKPTEKSSDNKIFSIEMENRYRGRDIGDMLNGENGEIIEALLHSDYINCNIDGNPIRKFLRVKYVDSEKSKVRLLLSEENFFKWNAIRGLADKLNVLREQGREVFDNIYGISIMGEMRESPLVSSVSRKVMDVLQSQCFNRDHSPFNFHEINPNWIRVRNAFSETDYESMTFIETLSGHPLTPIEDSYTPEFFRNLNTLGETQYIGNGLSTDLGCSSVIFNGEENSVPLEIGGIEEDYEKVAYVDYFAVLRSAQRKGVGRRILKNIEKEAKDLRKDFIYLNTPTINTDAVSFYSCLGFVVEKIVPNKYAPGMDAVLMCKAVGE